AAPFAPTWPSINGEWFPESLRDSSWTNHPVNVQFVHRMLAYLLTVVLVFWFGVSSKVSRNHPQSLLAKARWYPLVLVLLQVLLGVLTVLHGPVMGASSFGSYEILAEAHQLVAMF